MGIFCCQVRLMLISFSYSAVSSLFSWCHSGVTTRCCCSCHYCPGVERIAKAAPLDLETYLKRYVLLIGPGSNIHDDNENLFNMSLNSDI